MKPASSRASKKNGMNTRHHHQQSFSLHDALDRSSWRDRFALARMVRIFR
jgi:hypothetical protein